MHVVQYVHKLPRVPVSLILEPIISVIVINYRGDSQVCFVHGSFPVSTFVFIPVPIVI